MGIEADFEFEADEETVRAIYESIKEEQQERGTDTRRPFVDLALNGNTLRVSMRGEDATKLRAAANTWLRLLKVAAEMVQVIKECDTSGF
jgi:tRNA threonylcarbamoyladenosine modification (KEOPS) complex  Pcc1 subunit